MKTLDLYELLLIDDCEGRSVKVAATFSSEDAAKEYAISDQGRDMYKRVGDIVHKKLIIFDTAEEAGAESMNERKKQALKKLTDSDKAVLGIAT